MGLPPEKVATVRKGALLHDIGKIGVPDAILRKPAALDEAEMAVIRHHPRWGHEMIKDVPFLQDALPLVLHHHEKFDGSGYPFGLAGEAIPLEARIFAVVDAFDAMNSDRPYRSRMPHEAIVAELDRCVGRHFDPEILAVFKKVINGQDAS
jgi:HD-GYP domain-containing protein (c-di-GMP phosphodiesterase class II)